MEYIRRMRAAFGQEKILVPANAVVLLNEKKEVLLHLRGDSLTWGLPGGIMDLGETALESATREVLEETGLNVFNLQFFGTFSGPKFEVRYPNGDQSSPVILGFYSERFEGKLTTSPESPKVGFFSLEALPSPMNESHDAIVRAFRQFDQGKRREPVLL